MHPFLFTVAGIPVETYYVFWLAALSGALHWSVRRFPLYGVDDDEGRRVLGWAFLGMLLGARAFEYLRNFAFYWQNPSLILDLNRGGLTEAGAVSGAFITAFVLCRRNPRVAFVRLCDVVVLPAHFALALGRWGCFFAGCCVGTSSTLPCALHFPRDPAGLLRHPTQIYYSVAATLILLILWRVEKWTLKRSPLGPSLVTPLGLTLYTAMRLGIDLLRAQYSPAGFSVSTASGFTLSHGLLVAALPVWLFWLERSWRAYRGK